MFRLTCCIKLAAIRTVECDGVASSGTINEPPQYRCLCSDLQQISEHQGGERLPHACSFDEIAGQTARRDVSTGDGPPAFRCGFVFSPLSSQTIT
jgi:hypothetical protein